VHPGAALDGSVNAMIGLNTPIDVECPRCGSHRFVASAAIDVTDSDGRTTGAIEVALTCLERDCGHVQHRSRTGE
jgi:hypothetical protein